MLNIHKLKIPKRVSGELPAFVVKETSSASGTYHLFNAKPFSYFRRRTVYKNTLETLHSVLMVTILQDLN